MTNGLHMSGPLPTNAGWSVTATGLITPKLLRHIIRHLEMTAELFEQPQPFCGPLG